MDLREERKISDFGPRVRKRFCVKVLLIHWSNGISCGNLQLCDRMLLLDYYCRVQVGHCCTYIRQSGIVWWHEVLFLPAFFAEGAGNMKGCLFC